VTSQRNSIAPARRGEPTTPALVFSRDNWEVAPSGLLVPALQRQRPSWYRRDKPVAIDLFAGAGGMSLGFHQAGFHVAAMLEWDIDATATYVVNLGREGVTRLHFEGQERESQWRKTSQDPSRAGNLPLVMGSGWIAHYPDEPSVVDAWVYDAHKVTGTMILDSLGIQADDVYCVTGGPPCQGFSIAGKRQVMDPRNALVFEFARIVCEIQPRTFVMENVPGILSMVTPEGTPVVDALARIFADGGMGAYETLRRSLASFPGSSMVLKEMSSTGRPARERKRDEIVERAGAAQMTLFG